MSDSTFKPIHYLRLVTISGSLAMVYICCISAPVFTDLLRGMGASEFHFGLLGGVPMIMVLMQFFGAWMTNSLKRRRPWFMTLVIIARLLYLPIAAIPFCGFIPEGAAVPLILGLIALSACLGHTSGPMWLSWMGDLIPHRFLNRYWGGRQRVMLLVWAAMYLAIAAFTRSAGSLPARRVFAVLTGIGCTAGVIDILLFLRVREPTNVTIKTDVWASLVEPIRSLEFRSLLRFTCFFYSVSSFASAFMLIYILKGLHVEVWKATLVWCMIGLGNAMTAPIWGRIADRHGHRPVMRLCAWMKPAICLVFLLVTPASAVAVLSVAFFLDAILNAGIEISVNGFMLKLAPRENRSMFIAAICALSGVASGLGAILGGVFLEATQSFSLVFLDRTWNHYHLVFLISFLLRIPAIRMAGMILEPASGRSTVVLNELMSFWPMKALTFPVGLYRRWWPPQNAE